MLSDFAHGLTIAYGVMGFVALVGYAPQMLAFWRKPEVCAATPMATWVLWTLQTVVFHAYALFVNGDPMFMLTTGMFMLATMGCLGLIVRGRKIARASEDAPRPPVKVRGNVVPLRGIRSRQRPRAA